MLIYFNIGEYFNGNNVVRCEEDKKKEVDNI
jgi:hypothetical protein